MLEKAKTKNQQIEWKTGTAENTNLPDDYLDGIMGSLTIHHWSDLKKAFSELYRILKPNGRLVIFTSTPKQMRTYWLNYYFPKMLEDSIVQMPSFENVKSALINAEFKIKATVKYTVKPDLQDKFLYCGKHNPELYFDENIRQGISSFSAMANQEETKNGLANLRKDIDRGKINQIIKSYENDFGDYLYIIGIK
jgi:SAM-dependent methyltransferase